MKTYARIEDQRVAEIVSLSEKLETLYHPSLIWVDITSQAEPPSINDIYSDGVFTAPVIQTVDAIYLTRSRLTGEMEKATQMIAPLQDAVDLGIETKEEIKRLAEWKNYRVMLNRIDITQAPTIEWPKSPS